MPENEEMKTNESAKATVSTDAQEAEATLKLKKRNEELEQENASLKEAKSKYYDVLLNSNLPEEEEPKKRSSGEIRDELIKKSDEGCSNLDYWKLAIELDDACREENNGQSCFLPRGNDVVPTADEYARADKVHDVMKECIELSDGDPNVFNMQLEKHMLNNRR